MISSIKIVYNRDNQVEEETAFIERINELLTKEAGYRFAGKVTDFSRYTYYYQLEK